MENQTLFNTRNFYGDSIIAENIESDRIKTDYINEKTVGAGLFLMPSRPDLTWANHDVNVDKYVYIDKDGNISQSGYINSFRFYATEGKFDDLSADRFSARNDIYITICKLVPNVDPNEKDINISINYMIIDTMYGIFTRSGYITNGLIKSTSPIGALISALLVNDDVSATAGIVYSKLNLYNSILNADINSSAGIIYSKLNLSNSILNADINSSAGIIYSKLNLLNSIVNADIVTNTINLDKLQKIESMTVLGNINTLVHSDNVVPLNLSSSVLNNSVMFRNSSGNTSINILTCTNSLITDLINEYTLGSGVTIDSLLIKDGTLYDTAYGTGILHSDVSGLITSSLIVDADITNSTISNSKLASISSSNVVNTIMLRDAGGRSSLGQLYTNLITPISPLTYLEINGYNILTSGIEKTSAGNFTLSSNNGILNLYSTFGIYAQNPFHILTGQSLYTNNILEETTNNGVNIDGVLCKDGKITADLVVPSFTAGILHSDISGNITSSLIINADIDPIASIAYSKLNLSNSIVNGDIVTGTVALSKLASGTSAQVIVCSNTGVPTYRGITGDISISNTGITAIAAGVIVNNDVNASAAIAYSKLNLSNSILNADINSSAGIVYSKLNLLNSIVNADISTTANISDTKIDTISTSGKVSNSATTATEFNVANTIVLRGADRSFDASTISLFKESDTVQPIINYYHSRAGGLQTLSGDKIVSNYFFGTTNTSLYRTCAEICAFADENVTSTASGGHLEFKTTPTGSTIQAVRMAIDSTSTRLYNTLRIPAGSVSNCSMQYDAEADTGIYFPASDTVAISTGGTKRIDITNTSINPIIPIYNSLGSVSAPSYSFTGDSNNGIYSSGADNVDICTNGVNRVNINNTNTNINNTLVCSTSTLTTINSNTTLNNTTINTTKINNALGTNLLPSYTFTGDTNTGIYSAGADQVNITTGGTSRLGITTTVNPTVPIFAPSGTVSAPSYAFSADSGTSGLYLASNNDVRMVTNGGTTRMQWNINGAYASYFHAGNYSADGVNSISGILATGTLSNLTIGDSVNNFQNIVSSATWTRLFNQVTIYFSISWNGKGATTTGALRITGVPYASNSTYGGNSISSNIAGTIGLTYNRYLTLSCVAGTTYCHMYKQESGGADVQVLCSNVGTTGTIYCTLTYCT